MNQFLKTSSRKQLLPLSSFVCFLSQLSTDLNLRFSLNIRFVENMFLLSFFIHADYNSLHALDFLILPIGVFCNSSMLWLIVHHRFIFLDFFFKIPFIFSDYKEAFTQLHWSLAVVLVSSVLGQIFSSLLFTQDFHPQALCLPVS